MINYIERLKIPINGFEDIIFFSKNKLDLCKGYNRIVIGERGPYIEFTDKHIIKKEYTYTY